jgi:U3 small nucleolar RNA-associated protein 18
MSILSAAYVGTSSSCSEVVVAGRKPYFYSYDTASGAVSQVTSLMRRGLKTHETMAVSPLGSRIAFAGHGGYIHVVCGRQKTWQMDLKMNCACKKITFLDEDHLFSSGRGK